MKSYRTPMPWLVCAALCGLCLFVAAKARATTFHVDPGSSCSDTGSGTSSQPFCTLQVAANKLKSSGAPGDTVTLHAGTYTEDVNLPNLDGKADATRFVIQGDAAVAVGKIVVQGSITFASGGGQYVTLAHLTLRPTALPAVLIKRTGAGSPYWSYVTLKDLVIDKIPSGTYVIGTEGTYGTDLVFESIQMSNGGTLAVADAFQVFANNVTVRKSKIADIGGYLVYTSSRSNYTFEYNFVKNVLCQRSADGDGCLKGYNQPNFIVRYNVFDHVSNKDDGLAGVFNTRRTTSSTAATSGEVYHNTFISYTQGSTAAFNDAIYNSDNLVVGLKVYDNIFVGYGHTDSRSAAIVFRNCPASYSVSHNLYYNNTKDLYNSSGIMGGAGCAGLTLDSTSITGKDPKLDSATLKPQTGSPACGAGTSSSDIGAIACGGSTSDATGGKDAAGSGGDVSAGGDASGHRNDSLTDATGLPEATNGSTGSGGCSCRVARGSEDDSLFAIVILATLLTLGARRGAAPRQRGASASSIRT
jgi:hypothetical protein